MPAPRESWVHHLESAQTSPHCLQIAKILFIVLAASCTRHMMLLGRAPWHTYSICSRYSLTGGR